MDAKELIDDIERPSTDRTVERAPTCTCGEEISTGSNWWTKKKKCDHIIGARDELDMETESGFKDHMELCGDHLIEGYTKQDAFDVVFDYCPKCGEKLE